MRIVYGIHGYGRGHATRSVAVLPELMRRHEVMILAGGDAWDHLHADYPVQRIPTIGYHYRKQGAYSPTRTLVRCLPSLVDMAVQGCMYQSVKAALEDFAPDVAISDAEIWTHRAARRMGIPRIGFDHFGIMVYCRHQVPWADRLRIRWQAKLYRTMMGRPERTIVSSFYPAPVTEPGVKLVGPLLRPEVHSVEATDGDHLLVYLNKGAHQFTPPVRAALASLDIPVRIYGVGPQPAAGNLTFRSLSNVPFLEDLASCRAVFSTAGNQLVGEAMHFGKPMLAMPEDTVEQRLNGAAIERLGVGMKVDRPKICAGVFEEFLAKRDTDRKSVV